VRRSLIFALVPALVMLSCKDSNENPVAPDQNTPQVPGPDLARKVTQGKITIPQPSLKALAEAVKFDGVTLNAEPGRAPHDPTIPRMRVDCFSGDEIDPVSYPEGLAYRFRLNHEHGCELNTFGTDANPNNNAAIVAPTQNLTRGRKVEATQHMSFYYAGGPPIGGSPRFSLFIDECKSTTQPTAQHAGCPAGTATDGVWDETLFIDVLGCNDGDGYVGAVVVKAPNGKSDPTCTITEAYGGGVYPNWAAYVAAHPGARFADNFGPANGNAKADNFIISDQPQHYLIYRVNMRAGLT
jgi:hypothetical protein